MDRQGAVPNLIDITLEPDFHQDNRPERLQILPTVQRWMMRVGRSLPLLPNAEPLS